MRLIKPLKSFCVKSYLDDPRIELKSKEDIFNEMREVGSSIAFGGIIILIGII